MIFQKSPIGCTGNAPCFEKCIAYACHVKLSGSDTAPLLRRQRPAQLETNQHEFMNLCMFKIGMYSSVDSQAMSPG